jgi:hypothetical protein
MKKNVLFTTIIGIALSAPMAFVISSNINLAKPEFVPLVIIE